MGKFFILTESGNGWHGCCIGMLWSFMLQTPDSLKHQAMTPQKKTDAFTR